MNTSCVHPTGTLLLDMSLLPLLTLSLQMSFSRPPVISQSTENFMNVEPVMTEDVDMDEGPPDISCGAADDDVDTGGIPEAEADEVDGATPNTVDVPHADDAPQTEEEQVEIRRSQRTQRKVQFIPPKPVDDPYELLGPHEAADSKAKPFKRNESFKKPEGIEDPAKSRKRKRKQIKKQPLKTLSEILRESKLSKNKALQNPVKGTLFAELEQQFWQQFKKRQSSIKNAKKLQNHELTQEIQEEEEEIRQSEENGENQEQRNDDVYAAGDADVPADDDDDNDAPLVDDKFFDAIESAMSGHDSVFETRRENFTNRSRYEYDEVHSEYEELVRKHVDQYLARAQEYAQVTELSRRVSEWEDKVLPRLQEEDTHEAFDINKYGSKVLDNMDKKKITPFKHIVLGKQDFETSRIFLATLMLANTGNVKIVQKGILHNGMDKFELEMLSTSRHFEQLEEYQAPSIANKA